MKTLIPTTVALVLLAAGTARADNDKVDLMPGGMLCDRKDQVCYDQRGANVAETRKMFGEYAASDVQKRLGKHEGWGTKKFTLSNGVKCSVPNRSCRKEGGEGERAKKVQNHLFSAPQAR
jgi:hypothetical protein